MAQKLDILIHDFTFYAADRADLIFSDATKIRLDDATNVVELKAGADGYYPTDAGLYVVSPLFSPGAARSWEAFQAFISHVKQGLAQLTTEGFRLHDGTDQYWWNGADWEVNTSDWNTEAEVAANIGSFAATERQLRVVVNLGTTDKTVTPRLSKVKVAFKAKVEYTEDLIYRSLVPALRGIRFITDFAFPANGGITIALKPVLDTERVPFNVIGVNAVFDHSADPDHDTDLLSSYDSATQVITLISAIPGGNIAFVQLNVEPEVVVEASGQDYLEVEKVPSLIVTGIEPFDSCELNQDDFIVNKAAETAIRLPAPYRFNLRFDLIALAPGSVDLTRFTDAVVEFMQENPMLTSVGLDKKYRLQLLDEFKTTTMPNLPDLRSASGRAQLHNVLAWKRSAVTTAYPVARIKITGDMDVTGPMPEP